MLSKVKYDTELIKKITLFEDQTGAKVKDAFYYRDRLTYIVQEGEMGKALGRNKKNVKKIQDMINEKVKIVEYDNDIIQFIVNFLNPLELEKIEDDDGIIRIDGGDSQTNGLIIGRNGRNLKKMKKIVDHYFEFEDIKVEG